ncbi:MAG TPA: carbohydrate ABC transporter permease [Nocardioidaceae bacterium]|jgi:multiple sugar transport system permease protein|nr:carbohydrate ABC transporter permease [Nocardioidaceae bacterium]
MAENTLVATQVQPLERPARVPVGGPKRSQLVLEWIGLHAYAVAALLFFVLPFVFVLLTAVMTDQQALTRDLWPNTWEWSNFKTVWDTPGFLTWWRNTLMYATLGTVLMLLSSIPVAYALARFRFRGRGFVMMVVIATMMLPPQVVIVPMYLVWSRQFHLTGTLWPLIIPLAFGDPFSIFLLRQFFLTIPQEYVDAAKVDGCGDFRAMLRIVVPMAKPAIAAVALFQFFYCWNDYFGPQIYASENPAAWTLSYGLESFKSVHHTNWNLTMAATMLVMAPVIIVFFFAQKAFVEGVTLTGVKG